jgi:hypothetical protein
MKFSKEILCVLAATSVADVKSTFDKLSPTPGSICLQKTYLLMSSRGCKTNPGLFTYSANSTNVSKFGYPYN